MVKGMKNNIVIIVALVIIAMACIAPATAKAQDNPPNDPLPSLIAALQSTVNDILANVTQISILTESLESDVSTLQTTTDNNFTDINASLADIHEDLNSLDSGYIVYTSPYIHNNGDDVIVVVDAPCITEDVLADIKILNSNGGTVDAIWEEIDECGLATLTPTDQCYLCGQMGLWQLPASTLIIVKIKVLESESNKITFRVIQSGNDIQAAEFKVDETV